MVHYKLSVIYSFVRVTYGPLQILASVGLSVFYRFVRVAYGPLQTLASVGLSPIKVNTSIIITIFILSIQPYLYRYCITGNVS